MSTIRHGFTPGTGPFADPERCRFRLARRTCPWSRDEHDPDLPPEDVDAFGRREHQRIQVQPISARDLLGCPYE